MNIPPDHQIKVRRAQKMSWHCVMICIDYTQVTDDWIKLYINKDYACYGHYWYFECGEDALIFALRWA